MTSAPKERGTFGRTVPRLISNAIALATERYPVLDECLPRDDAGRHEPPTGDSETPRIGSPGESISDSTAWSGPRNHHSTDGGSSKFSPDESVQTPEGARVQPESGRTPEPSGPESREARTETPVCKYCGLPIDHDPKRCAALEAGVCRP